jgi:hypothetical protein
VIFLMFKRVQLLQLLLFFGPKLLAKPLKAYLKSVRSDKVRRRERTDEWGG